MSKRLNLKYSRRYRGKSSSTGRTESIRAKFEDGHTLEELTRLFQVFISELQDRNVERVDGCSFYFSAYDALKQPMTLANETGDPLKVMTIGHKRSNSAKTDEPCV